MTTDRAPRAGRCSRPADPPPRARSGSAGARSVVGAPQHPRPADPPRHGHGHPVRDRHRLARLPPLDPPDRVDRRRRARRSSWCAVYRQTSVLVWPASAMQTATSIALAAPRDRHRERRLLELRRAGTSSSPSAAFALLTKYVIRFRGAPRLQPVEHRSRRRLPRARQRTRRAARLLVGAVRLAMALAYAVIFAGGFCASAAGCACSGWASRSGCRWRPASPCSPRSATSITTRWSFTPISGCALLVDHHDLAGDLHLPVLHDHRPEDGAVGAGHPDRVRRGARGRVRLAHGAVGHRVRRQGRAAERPRRDVRGPAAARAPRPGPPGSCLASGSGPRPGRDRHRRGRVARAGIVEPGPGGGRCRVGGGH